VGITRDTTGDTKREEGHLRHTRGASRGENQGSGPTEGREKLLRILRKGRYQERETKRGASASNLTVVAKRDSTSGKMTTRDLAGWEVKDQPKGGKGSNVKTPS